MNKIYEEISKKTQGRYDGFRFPKITFGNRASVVTVVCRKEDRPFADAEKQRLAVELKEICEFNLPLEVRICDDPPTEKSLRDAVVAFTEKFTYVSSAAQTVCVERNGKGFTVKLKMHKIMRDLAQNDYIPRLKEMLCNCYIEPMTVEVSDAEISPVGTVETSGAKSISEYLITDVRPVIGSFIPEKAKSVASLTEREYNVAVCGVLVMPTAFISKGGRRYERFLLYDGESSVQCRFSPENGQSVVENTELINKCVCVLGNVEYDGFRNEATVSVRELSLCSAAGLKIVPSVPEPKEYKKINPQSYMEYVQSSMFDSVAAVPEKLKGAFVVFDFETTGLSLLYDRPTELGAVKIVDGKLQESFHTLIDPKRHIPPEVAAKTGITDDMVKGQPLFEDILPDFYKFSYGCSFVCHNIAFDFPFLIKCGNGCGYAFGDRKTFDTMALAPSALPGISKLSLDTVLEGLGLANDNAHRALSDAAATAKAFVAMHKILDKDGGRA